MKIFGSRSFQFLLIAAVLFGLQCALDVWKPQNKKVPSRSDAWIETVTGLVLHQKAFHKNWDAVSPYADCKANDKVETRDRSTADLHFGAAVVHLETNSSGVLRRIHGHNALELTAGTLVAAPKKDAPILIQIPGQPTLTIASDSFGRVALNKNPEGRYQVQLVSGEAVLISELTETLLEKNATLPIEPKDRGSPPYVFESPQAEGVVMGTEPKVAFAWRLSGKEQFKPARAQFLEFSSDLGFTRPYFSRTLINQAEIELNMSSFPAGVSEVYYRLRDSEGRASAVHKLLLAKTARSKTH